MSKSRVNTPAAPTRTREEMEAAIAKIAELKIEEQDWIARHNEAVLAEEKSHAEMTKQIADELTEQMAIAKQWADQNKAAFAGAKSMKVSHGVLGWRTGQPKLKMLKGFTAKKVVEILRAAESLKQYLRVKYSIDRAAILKARDTIKPETLEKMGVRITQGEQFFVDTEIKTSEARMKEAA